MIVAGLPAWGRKFATCYNLPERSITRNSVGSQYARLTVAKAIRKAMRHEPTIDWLLENQEQVEHYFHQLGVNKEL